MFFSFFTMSDFKSDLNMLKVDRHISQRNLKILDLRLVKSVQLYNFTLNLICESRQRDTTASE